MIAVRLIGEHGILREAVFHDLPLVLGRGPGSDFAIVDPSVSRAHARLQRDEAGNVVLEDLGSRNGLLLGAARVERAVVPANGTLRVRLGAVQLELAVDTAGITQELESVQPPGLWKPILYWVTAIVALASDMVIRPAFWSPWQKERLAQLTWVALGAAVGFPILAFVLVGLLRIAGRRPRVSDALRAVAVVAWVSPLLWLVTFLASYASTVGVHGVLATLLASGGLVAAVAYLASVARSGPRLRFVLAWAMAAGLAVAAFHAAAGLAARLAGTPSLDYAVQVPLGGLSGPASDLETYLERVRERFRAAERKAGDDRRRLGESQPVSEAGQSDH